jgi:ABC-type glycerol-3-phosphate transport system substrate-binding protein
MLQEDKMIKRIVRQALLLVVLLTTVASASSMQAASGKGEIVITCQNCEASSTDVFSQSWYNVVQAFNRTYTGKYRVQVQHYGGTANDLQYLERLELAGALPDIFVAQSTTRDNHWNENAR